MAADVVEEKSIALPQYTDWFSGELSYVEKEVPMSVMTPLYDVDINEILSRIGTEVADLNDAGVRATTGELGTMTVIEPMIKLMTVTGSVKLSNGNYTVKAIAAKDLSHRTCTRTTDRSVHVSTGTSYAGRTPTLSRFRVNPSTGNISIN